MTRMDLRTPTLHTDRLGKVGFVHEGTLRQDCVVNGDVSDSWVYGLIRSDWSSETTGTG